MILVLLSGGVDSSTALALAKEQDKEVEAVSFYYHQTHATLELDAAKKIAHYYHVAHRIIDVSTIFEFSHSSLNALSGLTITSGDYATQECPNTEVEFRNGVFISILASYAKQIGADRMMFGAHQDDSGVIYPDCSPEFISAMSAAVELGTGGSVRLEAPFMNDKKRDIVREGVRLGVPYELTYSCYRGVNPPCGTCGTCIDRKKAFEANGLEIL